MNWNNGQESILNPDGYVNDYYLTSTKYKFLGLKTSCTKEDYNICRFESLINGNFRYLNTFYLGTHIISIISNLKAIFNFSSGCPRPCNPVTYESMKSNESLLPDCETITEWNCMAKNMLNQYSELGWSQVKYF